MFKSCYVFAQGNIYGQGCCEGVDDVVHLSPAVVTCKRIVSDENVNSILLIWFTVQNKVFRRSSFPRSAAGVLAWSLVLAGEVLTASVAPRWRASLPGLLKRANTT